MQKLKTKIEKISNFYDDIEHILSYSYDASSLENKPIGVVFPKSTEEISQILKLCNQNKIKVIPRGSGTGMCGGSIGNDCLILSLEKMSKIININPINMSAMVQAGVINGDLQEALKAYNLTFGVDPASYKFSSIGGNLATNAGGMKALKHGCAKDNILGIRCVLMDGSICDFGHDTFKDSSGYDFSHLMVGSEGTLAIIAEAFIRLKPILPYHRRYCVGLQSAKEAIEFSNEILFYSPLSLEFMDANTIFELRKFIDFKSNFLVVLIFEVEAYSQSALEDLEAQITKICQKYNTKLEDDENIFKARSFCSQAITASCAKKLNNDITVPRDKLLLLFEKLEKIAKKYEVRVATFGHIGDGNMHINILLADISALNRGKEAVRELFEVTINLGGTLSGEHGIGVKKKDFLDLDFTEKEISLMRKIKKSFDENELLNKNKIFDL